MIKQLLPSKVFKTNVLKIGGNTEFVLLPIEIYDRCYFIQRKLIVSVEVLINAVRLVRVGVCTPFASFATGERLTSSNAPGFRFWLPTLDGE